LFLSLLLLPISLLLSSVHCLSLFLSFLDYIHRECQLIHTDLKPENILLSAAWNVSVRSQSRKKTKRHIEIARERQRKTTEIIEETDAETQRHRDRERETDRDRETKRQR
jgi:hypothetical protein